MSQSSSGVLDPQPSVKNVQDLLDSNNRLAICRKFEVLQYFQNKDSSIDGFIEKIQNDLYVRLNQFEREKVVKSVQRFRSKCRSKLHESGHYKNDPSLQENFLVVMDCFTEDEKCTPSKGPPRKSFEDSAERTKRRKVATMVHEVAETVPAPEAILGIIKASAIPKKEALLKIIQYCLLAPEHTEKVHAFVESETKMQHLTPYTEEEAYGLILDLGLSQRKYQRLRNDAKNKNANIYPARHRLNFVKEKVRPRMDSMTFTETIAKVELQALLDKTCERILSMNDEVLRTMESHPNNLTFYLSYGFDGSSGQSNYKQRFEDKTLGPHADSSLFATTVIPLQIVQKETGCVIWRNMIPQSIRFCRPLELHFTKETKSIVLEKKQNIESEITNLKPFEFSCNERTFSTNYELFLTIIDGKILNYITETDSCQKCPLCKMPARSFNDLSNIQNGNFNIKGETSLKHGINPLHAYIRLFELCLHVSYKLPIKTWQARGEDAKKLVQDRKTSLQNHLFKEMGLRVDYPSANGSGNSNDGNTARRAFANYEQFSKILDLDTEFVKRLWIILITINHNFPVNPEVFGKYCIDTAKLYVQKYQWYYMSSTLHRILIHGSEIIKSSVLPVGMLSEQAGESRNKVYKEDRATHSRRSSRLLAMEDTFLRSIDSSDPWLSTVSLSKQQSRKKDTFPQDALRMLLCPTIQKPATSHRRILFDNDSDEEETEEDVLEQGQVYIELENENEAEIHAYFSDESN